MFGYFVWNDAISSVRSLSSAGVDVHPLNRIVPEAPPAELLLPPQAVSSTAAIAASATPSRIDRMLPPPVISRPLRHTGVPSDRDIYSIHGGRSAVNIGDPLSAVVRLQIGWSRLATIQERASGASTRAGRGSRPCTTLKPVVLPTTWTRSRSRWSSIAPRPARRLRNVSEGSQSGRSGFTYIVRVRPTVWIPQRMATRRKTAAAAQAWGTLAPGRAPGRPRRRAGDH